MIATKLRVAAIAVVLAAPSVLVATALPTHAASSGRFCETYGNYCIGANSLHVDEPVVEVSPSSARTLTAVLMSATFENHSEYKLRFNGNTAVCVTGGPLVDIVIHNCDDAGTAWIHDGSGRWINVANTKAFGNGQDIYMAGLNDGNAYMLRFLGQTGFYYRFTWR
jgi:hypothetical protein